MTAALLVTGLYLAIGAGLLALLHRFVRPLSLLSGAALLLLPLCFTGRALLAGDSYGGAALAFQSDPLAAYRADHGMERPYNPTLNDVHGVVIPWRAAVRWAWSHGEWPLWNPFAGCGEPLAGSAQPAPYSFLELVTLPAPLPQSFTLSVSLVFLIAAAGAFLLAGDLGCRPIAAMVAAAGFSFGSYLAFWNAWPLGSSVAWLPLAVLAGWRLVAAPGPGAAAVLGVVLAQVLLSGHPESALHVIVIAGLAGAVELVLAVRARRISSIAPVLGWAGAGGTLALGLAALFLLPVADSLAQSNEWSARAATREIIHRTDWEYTRGALLADVVHFAFGLPGRGDSPARPPWLIPGSSVYGGSLLFPLALFALARSRSPRRWLLGGLLLFGLLAGSKMPGFFPLLGHLPLFEVSLNERLVFVASFSLAMLAGLGVEAALEDGRERRLGGWILGALAAHGILLAWLIPRLLEQGIPRPVVVAQTLAALLPLALGGVVLALPRGSIPTLARFATVLGLLLTARVAEAGWMYDRTPAEAFYPRVPPLDRLEPIDERDEPFRIVGFGQALLPNDATLYGLEDVRTYNAVHLKRFVETWPLWTERVMGFWFLQVTDIQNPFLAFLNAEYLIADRSVPRMRPWAREAGERGVRLYRNRRVLPRALVPARISRATETKQTLAAMRRVADFGERAWIEHASVPPEGIANGAGRVTARRRGTGYGLEVDLERETWIVVSETAWRGWRARARGEELEIAFANHAFLGVRAPAGAYQIELAFEPLSHRAGLVLSSTSLLGLALLVWLERRRRGNELFGSPAAGGAAAAEAAAPS
ncbi:MAG TPA: hypothetical protein VMT85_23290 [Thermoanaerobaculia bacterium]|nr:hypothetical protein [Thermoanaerobaculia bacterium]